MLTLGGYDSGRMLLSFLFFFFFFFFFFLNRNCQKESKWIVKLVSW